MTESLVFMSVALSKICPELVRSFVFYGCDGWLGLHAVALGSLGHVMNKNYDTN